MVKCVGEPMRQEREQEELERVSGNPQPVEEEAPSPLETSFIDQAVLGLIAEIQQGPMHFA